MRLPRIVGGAVAMVVVVAAMVMAVPGATVHAANCDSSKPECQAAAGSTGTGTGTGTNAPPERTKIYEKPAPAARDIDRNAVPTVPNLTQREADGGRGGSGASTGSGGAGSTGGAYGPALTSMVNPSPMSNLPAKQLLTQRVNGRTVWKELREVSAAKLEYFTAADGTTTATGVTYYFDPVLEGRTAILSAIFRSTAGDLSSCTFVGEREVTCSLRGGVTVTERDRDGSAPWVMLLPPPAVPASTRAIPLCAGGAFDSGPGVETVISVDDLYCDASPGTAPVGLRVIASSADPAAGVAAVDPGTGEVHYTPTAEAEGTYTVLTLAAVSRLDGFESWPFTVVIRNHYVPQAQDAPAVDALRGVDAVIPLDRLFRDRDVDEWSAYTHDALTTAVVADGAYGHATIDPSGDLRYHPIDALEGSATDYVTVVATDRFGIRSRPVTVEFSLGDVVPSCFDGSTALAAGETIVIDLDCRVDGPPEYHPLKAIEYSIVDAPEGTTVRMLDAEAGLVEVGVADDARGPVVLRFLGDNNGAVREGRYTLDVAATGG